MGSPFEALLGVQDLDIAIDQLRFKREHLEARTELADAIVQAKTLMPQHDELQAQLVAATQREKKMDDEVQTVRSKADDVNRKLYSGSVTTSKELQALQVDLDALKAHISKLEDAELEQMTVRDDIERAFAGVVERLNELQATVQRCDTSIVTSEADIDAQLQVECGRRATAATSIAPDLLDDYETRRANNRGQGVARLIGDTCQACRLSIPATEVDQVRHDTTGTAWYCDNCGAILVAN